MALTNEQIKTLVTGYMRESVRNRTRLDASLLKKEYHSGAIDALAAVLEWLDDDMDD